MSTLTYPTRFRQPLAALGAALLLAACASPPTPSGPESAASTKPVTVSEQAPSIVIKNKTAAAILDGVVKYRTQKGMKLVQRDVKRVELSMAVPRSNPPAEAHMIYSLSPATDGLRLSAQVFQIIRLAGKSQTSDITASLIDKLNGELLMYARQ